MEEYQEYEYTGDDSVEADDEVARKAEEEFRAFMAQIEQDSRERNRWYRKLARFLYRWVGEPILMLLKLVGIVLALVVGQALLSYLLESHVPWWKLL